MSALANAKNEREVWVSYKLTLEATPQAPNALPVVVPDALVVPLELDPAPVAVPDVAAEPLDVDPPVAMPPATDPLPVALAVVPPELAAVE